MVELTNPTQMDINQIAAEAADKIMEKQMTRGLIRDVAYTIIKAAIEKAVSQEMDGLRILTHKTIDRLQKELNERTNRDV